jgi:hypothetical protein
LLLAGSLSQVILRTFARNGKRRPLLFRSNDGGGRGFAIVAQIVQRILYASHFLDVPRNGTALLLRVRAARIYRSRHLGESSLARVGKVRKIFLDAGGDPTISREKNAIIRGE